MNRTQLNLLTSFQKRKNKTLTSENAYSFNIATSCQLFLLSILSDFKDMCNAMRRIQPYTHR